MTGPGGVLVAVDHTTDWPELEPVVMLAAASGWQVELLHVATPEPAHEGPALAPSVGDDDRQRELEARRQQLDEYARRFDELGITATPHLAKGPTIELILSEADRLDAAMIVVVGRRHPAAHRLVLGSTASALLRTASRPVLVVPTVVVTPGSEEVGFRSSLEQLIEVIDRERSQDLDELREAADQQLVQPGSDRARRNLGHRLVDAVERFETDHPSLIRAINDVSYYLSGMGI
ncbi:MAG: DUF4404 family protein [Acidimicrobiia bacterium]|nr:DUF4404 family protein [Acidimicrobiia bacterium]